AGGIGEDGGLGGGDAPDRGCPPVSGPSPADQRGGGRGEGDGPAGEDRPVRRANPPRSPALRAGGRGTQQRGRAGRAGSELRRSRPARYRGRRAPERARPAAAPPLV